MRGDLIETYKVLSDRESIDWVKPLNLRKNVDISGPASSVRGNSLSMRRESFSSRVRNSFCSWATIRDNFFVNRVVQTWNSLPNNIVTSPSLNSFKSSIDEHFKRFGWYSDYSHDVSIQSEIWFSPLKISPLNEPKFKDFIIPPPWNNQVERFYLLI